MALWSGWPPRFKLTVYERTGEIIFSARRHGFDLTDEVMRHCGKRRVVIGIKTDSKRWHSWDLEKIKAMEENFRYQFNFDGFKVRIKRLFEDEMPTLYEARWDLSIYPS
jgi:hypothetical protein